MKQNEKIVFLQSRDFGETFNVSVKFLKQNFSHFFLTIITIAGPFLLLAAIAAAIYSSNALNAIYTPQAPFNFIEQYGIAFILYIIAYVIAVQVMLGTTFSYMALYAERGQGNFTTADVGRKLLSNIGRMIILFLLVLVFSLIVIGIAVGIGFAFPNVTALIIIGVLILIFGGLIIGPPLIWIVPSFYQAIIDKEERSVYEGITYTFKILKGNFWWTWLLIVCASLAIGIASVVFTIPQAIYQLVLTFSHFGAKGAVASEVPFAFLVVTTVCTFLASVVRSILYIINGFHYYSLVEKKEGLGLLQKIDEIGNSPDTHVEQQY